MQVLPFTAGLGPPGGASLKWAKGQFPCTTQYNRASRAACKTTRPTWGPAPFVCCVVQVDPSSPNILNVHFVGDNVLAKLHRPFWTELQSRYGNMFYVREQVRHSHTGAHW